MRTRAGTTRTPMSGAVMQSPVVRSSTSPKPHSGGEGGVHRVTARPCG